MNIWVDADACPGAIKEVLFRAANRTGILLTLIANQHIRVPQSKNIRMMQVPSGFDVADNEIVKRTEAGDLIITSDLPLAAEVIEKEGLVLSPRGERLTKDNIGPRLNMRDFMETMRASGVNSGGPPAMTKSDVKAFADQLDRLLAKAPKN
ncbi:YaiI/YqxD family protein [Aliikangiella sp. G2MR2-5]|uniref:YaiI/YqxD family protein n=1 Tax=Aliikangiella sp. G2MR2-5 TaxID=2788943 RepID=UPI0018AA2CFC|nr:YaiI/YqxD family protein [Aliikangiella sp. G2MR2-5]